ncbi:MAG: nucleoside triphosphate pyrophosphohydrolase [Proteobacteria bacterium]|nr:nucleoside triphosphate pyrophosphohydrolase [Desulfobacula sp.]MBU4131855.1 nucleoside triphosphate pyrophosphohydrolase [Pseudomonadota bacterium]
METISPLLEIIRRLRGKDGCAWDQKQTPLTMWRCLAEEAYELQAAIVNDDTDNICEELGDVLFQVLFVLEIFIENDRIEFSSVVDGIAEKMIRRHPHVYGTAVVTTEEELHQQWAQIKSCEKKKAASPKKSALDAVPKGMPGLLRALKVSKAAVREGFDWENIHQVLDKVKEEIHEFEAALENESQDAAMMEFGDILFSLVNVARFAGFHPETALSGATAKFEGRFRLMETVLAREGIDLKTLSPEEKELHWQRAKQVYDR